MRRVLLFLKLLAVTVHFTKNILSHEHLLPFDDKSRATFLLIFIFLILQAPQKIVSHESVRYLANIYSFKANNRNTRKRREICSKLTIKRNVIL